MVAKQTEKEPVEKKAESLLRNREDGREYAKEKKCPIDSNIIPVMMTFAKIGLWRNVFYIYATQAHEAT